MKFLLAGSKNLSILGEIKKEKLKFMPCIKITGGYK